MVSRDFAVCIHEGAHIVTAAALGQKPTEATVWPIGKCSSKGEQGLARYRYVAGCPARTKIAITSAGPLAKLRFDPASDPGWASDAPRIAQVANEAHDAHAETKAGCELARRTIDEQWSAIMLVAKELSAAGTITGARVKELIQHAAAKPQVNRAGAGSLLPESDGLTITGVATVYSRPTWDSAMRGLAIKFLPGAFSEFIASQPDIALQAFHDSTSVVARTLNGSVQVWESGSTVNFTANLIDTSDGRSLYEKVKAGLLDECSIGLKIENEDDAEWSMLDKETPLMTVKRGSFDEISVVRSGAMKGTTVRALRAGERGQQQTQPPVALTGRITTGKTIKENEERIEAAAAGLSVSEYRRQSQLATALREVQLDRIADEIAAYREQVLRSIA
jgi:hypothetical protein